MSLVLAGGITAMAAGRSTFVGAQGGVEPYVYSIVAGGALGTIDASSGLYTAPLVIDKAPKKQIATLMVTDAAAATATYQIKILRPIMLFCDVIEKEMNLPEGRIYLWDQKINSPTDDGLFIAVGEMTSKPFANNLRMVDGVAVQSVNMLSTLSLDIISRGPEARDRKEEVIMALNSIYSQQQQELNSFYIAKLSTNFVNLSPIDGAAIPYRFNISVSLQYFVTKAKEVPYFDEFPFEYETES